MQLQSPQEPWPAAAASTRVGLAVVRLRQPPLTSYHIGPGSTPMWIRTSRLSSLASTTLNAYRSLSLGTINHTFYGNTKQRPPPRSFACRAPLQDGSCMSKILSLTRKEEIFLHGEQARLQ